MVFISRQDTIITVNFTPPVFRTGTAWIRIDFGRPDPDPHWEYRSGSRRAIMTYKNRRKDRNFKLKCC
jgi:hypothetical protein